MHFPAFRKDVSTFGWSLVENVRFSSMQCSHDRDMTGVAMIVMAGAGWLPQN
jgi:hypothetical protein